MRNLNRIIVIMIVIIVIASFAYMQGRHDERSGSNSGLMAASAAAAQDAASRPRLRDPNGTVDNRYVYYPGTEPLARDEIRLIAAGTGLPAARRGQAATCFLVELGNGDKFLFDIGSGSMANITALIIPYDMLNTIFLTHLHTDH